MAGSQSPKGAVVVQYLKNYPKMPLLALAKLMNKKEPNLFPDIENARKLAQKYASSGSNINPRDKYGVKREKNGVAGQDAWQDMMPESVAEELKPHILPKAIKKLAILSDIHIPYHDVVALRAAIEHCVAEKPDAVLLNGDTMDFYAMSFHEKDPRLVDWAGEIEGGRMLMQMLRNAFPNIPIIFKAGNHCVRLERHLMKYSPMLLGMEEFELPSLLRFGETGVQFIANKVNIQAGKLNIIHGDEYKGAGGVNPARWLSLRTGENSLCGHFHRTSSHMDRTIRHDIRGWWSTGCLCELTPKYMPYSQWNLGFAIVHLNQDQSFEVENMTIVNGKVR
jgi:hypothetical protein